MKDLEDLLSYTQKNRFRRRIQLHLVFMKKVNYGKGKEWVLENMNFIDI